MANKVYIESTSQETAQASEAISADSLASDGNVTTLDRTHDGGSENMIGCSDVTLLLDVTAEPSTDATAEVWYRISQDGTDWSDWRYSHTVGATIASAAADLYDAGLFELVAPYCELKIKAIDYGFTCTLYAQGNRPEIQ